MSTLHIKYLISLIMIDSMTIRAEDIDKILPMDKKTSSGHEPISDDDIYDYEKIDRINALQRMGFHVEYSEADITDMRKLDKIVARQMEKEKSEGSYRTWLTKFDSDKIVERLLD